MLNFLSKRKLNIICAVISLALTIIVWVISYFAVGNEYVVPSFSQTLKAFFTSFAQGEFWIALAATLLRTLSSFLISFILAAVCAALSALSKVFKLILNPFIIVLRTLPTLAVILILLIWTNAKTAPVIVTVLVLFPMLYAQFIAAAEGIDGDLIEMAQVYRISKRDRIFKIYLPQISPNIFSQLGADFSLGLKVMISAEVLSNTYKSLGGLMQNAKLYLEMPRLAALTVTAVLLGLVFDVALSQLARINAKWRGK